MPHLPHPWTLHAVCDDYIYTVTYSIRYDFVYYQTKSTFVDYKLLGKMLIVDSTNALASHMYACS